MRVFVSQEIKDGEEDIIGIEIKEINLNKLKKHLHFLSTCYILLLWLEITAITVYLNERRILGSGFDSRHLHQQQSSFYYGGVLVSTGVDRDFGSRTGDGPNPSKTFKRKQRRRLRFSGLRTRKARGFLALLPNRKKGLFGVLLLYLIHFQGY